MSIRKSAGGGCVRRRSLLIRLSLLIGALPAVATADIVTDWSAIATTAVVTRGAPAGGVDFAIVHAAMYDAVNAIDGRHETYLVDPGAETRGASPEAAAAAAAHRTLVGLFPAQTATLDTAYTTSLATLPDGAAKTKGIAVGVEVATRILEIRANDGRNGVVPYVFGTGPGVYQKTPAPYPPNGQPVNTFLPQVTPMAMQSPWQFRSYGPPGLGSARYTRDLAEVRAYGSLTSTVRTEEQSEIARFHTENPNQFWGRNLSAFVASRNLGTARSARLLALLTFASADAQIGCFDAKYAYNFWRPVTAIQQADTDGNPATQADPAWAAFVPTPPHPEYPAAHGCVAGAVAQTLREYFGRKHIKFAFTSTVTGTTHYYESTDDLVREIVNARIYGGMHYRNSGVHGAALGKSVATWTADNALRPRKRR